MKANQTVEQRIARMNQDVAAFQRAGKIEEGIALADKAFFAGLRELPEGHFLRAQSARNRWIMHEMAGNGPEAVKSFMVALDSYRKTLHAYDERRKELERLDQLKEAFEMAEAQTSIARTVVELQSNFLDTKFHNDVGDAVFALAKLALKLGKYDEARAALDEAAKIALEEFGPHDSNYASVLQMQAELERQQEGLLALTPLWLQSTGPLPGTSNIVTSDDLYYSVPLLEGWAAGPEVLPSAMQTDHVYQGREPGDWLVVSFMAKAVPGHNMLNWVQVPLTKLGFPSIQLASRLKPTPELLAWNDEAGSDEYMEKLRVEEMHGFAGLGRIGGTIARLYVLMLRKATFAWMFFLSLQSHAGAGSELVTLRDDHCRAGMVFGNLRLFLAAESAAPTARDRHRNPSAR